ncbi:serine/threonine protein phosphatase [Hymenobacter tibetensis]|uniref:Serine/threonine protein phosphatase n=1 Tax=Hymenobacter tibetensis TaxID=497967 RepID=A0ABY4CU67_9BACT|nr:metallophosphoesterase family protein [Hymenobacter tibetensis]UOG73582.1 serine/threonine protein phosphatase [Hymenobacter tibetensis]
MNLFVVGDVHGCYHTFRELLQHWQPKKERLIQLGDLMDRGNFAPECVGLAMELNAQHPEHTMFLKGNHEAGMLDYYSPHKVPTSWLEWGGSLTKQQYEAQPELLAPHLAWLKERPLYWENDAVFASHAGISDTVDPFDEENPDGILWYRGPLLNIGKLQLIGHTPTPDGLYSRDLASNSLNLDTGAVYGHALTGVRVSADGQLLEAFSVPTHRQDSLRVK